MHDEQISLCNPKFSDSRHNIRERNVRRSPPRPSSSQKPVAVFDEQGGTPIQMSDEYLEVWRCSQRRIQAHVKFAEAHSRSTLLNCCHDLRHVLQIPNFIVSELNVELLFECNNEVHMAKRIPVAERLRRGERG